MRCIEIKLYFFSLCSHAWINYNMRCIEINIAMVCGEPVYDKLQHEMY